MNRPRNFEDILSRLTGVKQSGDNWIAPCPLPGHKTPAGHLSLTDGGDKALVTCQGGKHSYKELCQWLGYSSLNYSDNGHKSVGQYSSGGVGCYSVTVPKKQGDLASKTGKGTVTPPALQSVMVSILAEAKCLPVDFLKSLGISDLKYNGQGAVRIPYYGENGQELAARLRLSLTGDNRFRWRKGDRAMPYGLNRLGQIKKAGWVLIVEGESDCWTGWFHDIPTLGAPGKGIWPLSWREYLKGIEVYVWQEPEAEDFVLRILASAPDLRYIRAQDGIKDISEAHIQGVSIPTWLEELKAKAESGQALKARYDNERLAQLYIEARHVIEAQGPLELVEDAIRGLGYGGDLKPALITYLAATSRLLAMRDGAMPVHLVLTGPSSSGKSYTLTIIKKLLPDEAHYTVDAGSPRIIIYNDAPLEHRVLIFGEADSLPAGEDSSSASAIRNLLQDHYLHYEVTIRDPATGDFTAREVNKSGPTVLITTSTRSLGDQLMTRLFTLEISDSREQIGAALETQATLETDGPQPLDGALVAFQAYLQLKAPFKVIVPFARELARAMGKMTSAPRISRDFARLLSLIKSVAVIRHHWRQTDNDGRLVATLADYETVRELVNDMYIVSSTGADAEIRELVELVKTLDASRTEGERITVMKLATHLNIGKMAASRRAKRALKEDWLLNRESRKGYPADFAIGEPMPETEGLPLLDRNTVTGGNSPLVTDSSFNNRDCNAVTRLTDDNVSPPSNDTLEAVLGMPVEMVVEAWRSEGAPVVHLGPGENCEDLAILLANPNTPERHIQVVRSWLENVLKR